MYIVFEGIDGVGKSTQIERFRSEYPDAVFTKEPGATRLGAKIRELVLDENDFSLKSELFLFLADRAEHAQKLLIPNIKEGKDIFSDRSLISGIAYAHDSFEAGYLCELNRYAVDDTLPDKAVIMTISEKGYLERIKERGEKEDNIEKRGLEYMMKVQERFIRAAKLLGVEYIEIDALQSREDIFKKIKEFIDD